MPRDHFVPQTYLARFCDPSSDGLLNAYEKPCGRHFRPNRRNVCVVGDGSTNRYLEEPRAIESFLASFEPYWNRTVDNLLKKNVSVDDLGTIVNLVVALEINSPTSNRTQAQALHGQLKMAFQSLELSGQMPPPPPELGGESLVELINNGIIDINVDLNFPQAIGVTHIDNLRHRMWGGYWDFFVSDYDESPFLTSDYPFSFSNKCSIADVERFLPITPNLLLRVRFSDSKRSKAPSAPLYRFSRASRETIVNANRSVVRCAERFVFSSCNHSWIGKFVRRNGTYSLEALADQIPGDDGTMLVVRRRAVVLSP